MKLLTACLPFLFLSCLLGAESGDMDFSHIGVENGLSRGAVNAICQDSRGNMWFGTDHGINVYNGYQLKSYTSDSAGLPGDRITGIRLGPDSKIWASCASSLIRYEEDSDSFSAFCTSISSDDLYDFCFVPDDPQGRILLGYRYSLCCFNPRTGEKEDSFIPETMRDVRVSNFFISGSTLYLACRSRGDGGILYKWDFGRNEITTVDLGGYSSNINKVIEHADTVWLATETTGLLMSVPVGEGGARKTKRFTTTDGMCSDMVRAILADDEGGIWAGTFGGVNVIRGGRITEKYVSDANRSSSISHNTVRSLFKDSQGGIWLGNYYMGVDYCHSLRNRFHGTRNSLGDDILSKSIVSCIVADCSDASLWLGVAGKGVYHYGADGGLLQKYVLNELPGRKADANDIKTIFPNPFDGKIYVGGHGSGFRRIDPSSGQITLLAGLNMENLYSIIPLGKGNVLALGSLSGIFLYDIPSGECTRLSSDIRIKSLETDSDGLLWAGGANGIALFGQDGTPREVPRSMKELKFIYEIFRSSSGDMYFSTDTGLYRYIPSRDKLIRYTVDNGLSCNIICSVLEDRSGKLWISTANGLNCLNPYMGQTRRYYSSDGLSCSQFIHSSSAYLADGTMIFGTLKGVVSFSPEQTKDNPFSPKAQITALDINGRYIPQKNGTIRLRHDNNFVSLNFSVPNYLAAQHSTFAFRTDLSDEEWHYISNKPTLNLTNISPGTYYLEVKAANNNLKWCPETTILSICVLPAWYQTLAFRIFLILVSAAVLLLCGKHFYDKRLRILEERRRAEMAALDKDFLAKAEETVRKNLRDPDFTTTELAGIMCVSRSTLYTKLKALTDESALEFIRRIRFAEACRLLKEDKPLPISEISELTGFRSVSYFSTSFKAYIGCLPSEFKKKSIENGQ